MSKDIRRALMVAKGVTSPAGEVDRQTNLARHIEGNHPLVPNVLYHGTARDIRRFETNAPRGTDVDPADPSNTDTGWFGKGHYLTPYTTAASFFAKQSSYGNKGEGANIMPIHPSLKNPFIVNIPEDDSGALAMDKALNRLGAPFPSNRSYRLPSEQTAFLKSRGHDGVIATKNGKPKEFVLFDDNQLKSATGNRGTFDPTDPDITKARGGSAKGIGKKATDDDWRGSSDSRLKVWANRPDPITRADHILNGNTVTTPEDEVLQFPTREHAVNYIDSMVGHWPRYSKGGSAERSALMVAKDVAKKGPSPVEAPDREANLKRHMAGNHPDVPHVVYIGTTGDFNQFKRSRMNPGSDHGQGFYASNSIEDVNSNYAGEGPDLSNRIERYIDTNMSDMDDDEEMSPEEMREAAKEALGVKHQGMVMPVHYSMKNPIVIGGKNETFYDYKEPYNEQTEEYGEPSGSLLKVFDGILEAANQFDIHDADELIEKLYERAAYKGGIHASDLEGIVKDHFSHAYDPDTGESAGNEAWRTALEEAGHDGIIDHTVDSKFGSARRGFAGARIPGMPGVTPDTTHYVAFKPQQIKSAIGNNGNFSPASPVMTEARGGAVTKAKGGSIHPATQIPGVHISERTHGKPIFTGERIGKEGGGSLTGKDPTQDDEGIIAYQGGPHSVGPEGYDNAKIGTGEGAQAYGYGHYFAEAEPTAEAYRDSLAHKGAIDIEHEGRARGLDLTDSDARVAVMRHADTDADPMTAARRVQNMHAPLRGAPTEAIADLIEARRASTRGHMHQVRIQGRPEHFLDWDAPLSEQPHHLEAVVQAVGGRDAALNASRQTTLEADRLNNLHQEINGKYGASIDPVSPHPRAKELEEATEAWHKQYKSPQSMIGQILERMSGKTASNQKGSTLYSALSHGFGSPKDASEALSGMGIKGIRYFDSGSRTSTGDRTRNYVVFDPKHIDIQRRYARGGMAYADGGSTPDDGVQKALDLTRDLNPQGLYSHAAEAAMASPQAKGPLPQMLASLKGVKPDELKYSGVQQAFADQPRVTREELAQHFQKSLPDIQETTLRQGGNEGPAAYQGYTLPGGDNYREVLLHLPASKATGKTFDDMTPLELQNFIMTEDRNAEVHGMTHGQLKELARNVSGSDGPQQVSEYYQSGHWPQKNVLAHLRLKDRTGPNGEKILHAEEIQSDWGQQARHEGTYNPASPYQVFEATTGKVLSEHATPEEAKVEALRHRAAGNEGVDHGHVIDTQTDKGPVPDAPYIGNTQNWTDLALKRLLHEAAAGGYDKVVWTPGAEQAKRYGKADSSGMEGYYGKVVPKSLLALARQHDPEAQLETTRLPVEDRTNTPEEIASELGISVAELSNMSPQKKQKVFASVRGTIGTPGLTITPRMRESILKRGFKAYARGGDVEGTMRIAKAGGGPLGDDEAVKKALALTAQTQAPAPQQAVQTAKQQAPSAFFEIAPGKTYNPTLQQHWEMLRPQAKAAISNKMIGEYLSRWQRISGIQGEVRPGHGGFAGYTNPNYTFHPYDPNDMQRSLHELGDLFSQDAMMGAHEHPFSGSSPSGVVRINMPPGVSSQEVHRVYKALHEKGLAEGHSTNPETGTMDILAGSGGEDTIAHAKAIDAHLNGKYDVSSFPTNVSFPTHGADYGVSGTLSGGASEPSTSEAYNNLKAEASRRLEELVKQAHIQRGGRRGEISFGDTLAPGQPHPDTVSASMPTHAAVYKGPPLPGETRADISPSQHSNPNLMATASRMWAQHPASGGEQLDGPQAMKKLTDFHVKNLLELWDRTPIEQRKTSRHWYRSAHQVGNAIAEEHGLPPRAAHGMMAVLSPQTPWDRNVSLAERVADAMTHHQDTPWTAGMSHVAYQGGGGGKGLPFDKGTKETGPHHWADIEGKTLRQVLEGPHGEARAAMWVRAFDEAHNPSEYRAISPTGEFMGTMLNKTGSAPDTLSWNSYSPIKKAISIYRNPSLENINEQIGTQHKVREFYNTIANPDDPNAVVADTHAVAAGQMLPHGSSAKAVHQNFGSIPSADQKRRLADAGDPWIEGVDSPKKTGSTGATGDYPIHAEAVRQAAWARGVHPSEMQSVTWETVRTLFRNKSRPVQKAAREIWGRYAKGQLNHKQAIDALFNMAGGLARPNWASQAGRGTGNITTGSYKKPSGITPETPALERYGSSNTEEEPMSTGGVPQKQRSVVHDALRLTSRYGQPLPNAVNLARQHTRGRP